MGSGARNEISYDTLDLFDFFFSTKLMNRSDNVFF